jgi:acylphosphatase
MVLQRSKGAMEAIRVILTGRVQGVGFRYFVYREAQRFRVAGWVRNLYDGGVEVHAEGDPETLRRFLEKIRRGPPMAFVSECRVDPAKPSNCNDFLIRG